MTVASVAPLLVRRGAGAIAVTAAIQAPQFSKHFWGAFIFWFVFDNFVK